MLEIVSGKIVDRDASGKYQTMPPDAVVMRIRKAVGEHTLLQLIGEDAHVEIGHSLGARAIECYIHTYTVLSSETETDFGALIGGTAPDGMTEVTISADTRESASTYTITSPNSLYYQPVPDGQ